MGSGNQAYLGGTPTAVGTFTFTVRATAAAAVATKVMTLHVVATSADLLTITGSWVPGAKTGQPYGYRFTASALAPLHWTASGTLPPGLKLGDDGVLTAPRPRTAVISSPSL